MEKLAGLIVYLGLALFIPAFIARTIAGADWRTVRNACLIWYGLLILVFGGLSNPSEGLGWAMIFAMFWSIPAIPVIALVIRLWSYLRRLWTGPASQAS